MLYDHFGNLEDLLAAFAIDRARLADETMADLPLRAGEGTVAAI